jgi:GxxExxY protein
VSALKNYSDLPEALNELTGKIVDCFFQVHKNLGPGYLEKIYEDCLCIELSDKGLAYQRQYPIKFIYKERTIPSAFRLDLVIENAVIIELKAVHIMHPVFEAQMYSYLQTSELPVGFLVNFNTPLIKDGIKRFVSQKLRASGSPRLNQEVAAHAD